MLALLHTAPILVPTFERLRDEEAPGLRLHHVVAEELLAQARREGAAAVTTAVESVLVEAGHAGATAVLCTCSTIGGIAEAASGWIGLPVLRVDRPMAAAAVAAGPRIRVLAALRSTVAPTVDLIEEEAARAGREVSVEVTVLDGAWEQFESGAVDGYHATIARAISTVPAADVIVLAQASMAAAAPLATTVVPVLSSPRLGLRAAAKLVTRG